MTKDIKGRVLHLADKKTQARHSDYEHTISGVLHRRVDLYHEAERLHDRLAEIKNDIQAIDRTLNVLGYEGDYDAAMPRQKRHVIFGKGELTKAVFTVLRRNAEPMTSREIAKELVCDSGFDARDRQFVTDLTKRVSVVCRKHTGNPVRRASDDKGNLVWGIF